MPCRSIGFLRNRRYPGFQWIGLHRPFQRVLQEVHPQNLELEVPQQYCRVGGSEKIIESGSKKLENEANKTREELKQQLSSIVVETASKIIDEEIDEKKHENIIKKAAEEI